MYDDGFQMIFKRNQIQKKFMYLGSKAQMEKNDSHTDYPGGTQVSKVAWKQSKRLAKQNIEIYSVIK